MLIQDIPTIINLGVNVLFSRVPYYPLVASFDVTNKCTLKCKHCYWWLHKYSNELEDDVFFNKVKEIKLRHPSLLQAVWVGGEPLLRSALVERCKKLFSSNRVVTNGTLPLPAWKDVRFICSVDGTKEFDELQRGKNTYDRIKKNINRSDLDINIYCVITKLNYTCLEEYVEEWSKTYVRSAGFGFFTPSIGMDNESLWLDFERRNQVIDRILKLKKKYPKFISSSVSLLNHFRYPDCLISTERCRRDYSVFSSMSFDPLLVRKFPCVIGDKADCEKCGCVGSTMGEVVRDGDKGLIIGEVKNFLFK